LEKTDQNKKKTAGKGGFLTRRGGGTQTKPWQTQTQQGKEAFEGKKDWGKSD